MNVIYLTDGAARKIKIGNRIITFKSNTKKCSGCGENQQSCHTGVANYRKENVQPEEIKRIQDY